VPVWQDGERLRMGCIVPARTHPLSPEGRGEKIPPPRRPPMPAQPDTFTVGLVQMRCTPDPGANLDRAVAGIREAARKGAQIICLPGLFLRRYFCQRVQPDLFSLAEPIPGPTTERLAETARQTSTVVVAPVFERRTAGVYHNSAAILDADGKLL